MLPHDRRVWARVAALYALLLAVVYLPVSLLGRTLSPEQYQPHGVTERGPWGPRGRLPVATFHVDLGTPAYYEAPMNRLVGALVRRGEPPLWNPYQGLGAPLAAQYSTRALFPYQLLEDLAPARWADLFLLGRLWLAAVLTFGFLRRLTATPEAAFLGGVLYALSGSMVWFINLEQMASVGMVLPGFLWACEALASAPRPRAVALAAVATALVLLAGQPESALFVLVLGALWTLFRGWRVGVLKPALASGAVAALLGLCLSAPLLAPFAEFYSRAFHLHSPNRVGSIPAAPWFHGVQLLTPSWFERPVPPLALPATGYWDWLGGYTGALTAVILLAVLPRWRFRHRPEALFLTGAGLTLVLKNLGVPPFSWLLRLPLFDMAFSNRWAGHTWCFALAAAAALCADALASPERADLTPVPRERLPLARALQVLGLAFLASFYLAASFFPGGPPTLDRSILPPELPESAYHLPSRVIAGLVTLAAGASAAWLTARPRPGPEVLRTLCALGLAELWFAVPLGLLPGWAAARVVGPALLGVGAWALYHRRPRVFVGLSLAAALASGALDLAAPRGLPDRRDAYRPPPYIPFLQARAGHQRVMGTGGVLYPNYAGVYGLRDVRYIHSLVPEETLWLATRLLTWNVPSLDSILWFTGASANLAPEPPGLTLVAERLRGYSLVGVRYVITPRDDGPRAPDLPPALSRVYHAEVDVYENRDALPRAWVVHSLEPSPPTLERVARRLTSPEFDPRASALLAPGDLARAPTAAPSTPSTATITRDDAHDVTVSVRASAPGLMVLSDAYLDTWEATVDGADAPVLRVNGCMRGVPVPAGEHVVSLRYPGDSFRLGVYLAAFGLVGCYLLARRRAWSASAPEG